MNHIPDALIAVALSAAMGDDWLSEVKTILEQHGYAIHKLEEGDALLHISAERLRYLKGRLNYLYSLGEAIDAAGVNELVDIDGEEADTWFELADVLELLLTEAGLYTSPLDDTDES